MNVLQKFICNPYLTRNFYKQIEQETFRLIFLDLPSKFSLFHVRCHQDDDTEFTKLDVPTSLNIDTEKIASTHITQPVSTRLITTLFAVYINNKYIPYNITQKIRSSAFTGQARTFL